MPKTIMKTRMHIDAERIDHDRILDARAHDHAEARAVEHEVERHQRDRDDADDRKAVGRIDHEAERCDSRRPGRRRHGLREAAEEEADGFDEDDPQTEGDQDLVLGRAV